MSAFGQKIQIHYLVMDTLKSKNEFLEFVKFIKQKVLDASGLVLEEEVNLI